MEDERRNLLRRLLELEAEAKPKERTIIEMYDEWLALLPPNSQTTRCRRIYRRWLEVVFSFKGDKICLGLLTPSELSPAVLIAWQNAVSATPGASGKILAPPSVNQVRLAVQSMFSHAVYQGEMVRNPLHHRYGVPRVKGYERQREGTYTPEQVAAIAAQLPYTDAAIWRHIYATGARAGTIRNLRKHEIDYAASELIVNVKGRQKRIRIPVPKSTLEEMRRHAEMNSRSEYVYPNPLDPKGRPISGTTFNRRCDKAVVEAGVGLLAGGEKPVRHHLRHTRAGEILKETGDITLVKAQLGHTSIRHSLRYAEREEVQLKRLHDFHDKDDED